MSDEYIPMPKNPKRKYSGEYIGVVETGVHDAFMQVQVRVRDLFTDNVPAGDLPWATYRLPPGSRGFDGFFIPVKKGDYVWVDFPFYADTRRPRITGSVHFCPNSKPNFPGEAWPGGQDRSVPLRTGLNDPLQPSDSPKKGRGDLEEPPCVFKQNGVTIEILVDGTVRITNQNPKGGVGGGSNIEISKTGDIIIHAEKSLFLSTKVNQENAIHGDSNITALGDKTQSVLGDVSENTKGQHSISGVKKVMITSDATVIIKAPKVEIN